MIIKVGKAAGLQERTIINSKVGAHAWSCASQRTRQRSGVYLSVIVVVFLISGASSFAANSSSVPGSADSDSGEVQNLHLSGKEAITYQFDPNGHILVFQDGLSMTVSQTVFTSDQAVIWLMRTDANSLPATTANQTKYRENYTMTGYLAGHVRVKTSGRTVPNLSDAVMPVWFRVSGEVLITAEKKETYDPRGLRLYADAYNMMQSADIGPTGEEAMPLGSRTIRGNVNVVSTGELGESAKEKEPVKEQEPVFRYPITLAPKTKKGFVLDVNDNIATVTGGFYLSQKQEVDGKTLLLELQADDAVIFLPESRKEPNEPNESKIAFDEILSAGTIRAIYLCGDVLMTEGQRTIRADEIYYDLADQKAIVINAVMRNFDVRSGIPIYVRAAKLEQLAANKFSATDATLTTSEFYVPQISLSAGSIIITDNTAIDQQEKKETKNSYDAILRDVTLNYYDTKLPLYFPRIRTNMERPDVPIKSVRAGNDNIFGTYVETSWYTARLLGLEEPEGTDSTLYMDYYSDRGPGGGIEAEYSREDYYGKFLGYLIKDHGEDQLGRISSRRNLEPPEEMRGRFFWQDRHFLPYRWQLTTELSYLSDEHFLESFYRDEYNLGKQQETLAHMKRIQDDWGLSFLAKARINKFENVLEEMPTAQFHMSGHSFWDDKLTFYSDSQVSRLRQRYEEGSPETAGRRFFTFMSTRNEVDLPLSVKKVKVVPFAALTAAYEDELGFYRALDNSIRPSEADILIGEFGVRGSMQPFWKVFPDVNSELWDLNQLRHVLQPHLMAVDFIQNHAVAEQRDILNVGITQRLQTKRGSGALKRTVDWMRLDTDITWVNNSTAGTAGADRFIWDKPFIPLINEESTSIPQVDRRGSAIYGPRHNYFSADYLWNMSDSTAFLSDMYFDMHEGVVEQLDFGFSHMRQPNLSYYVGSRYLRDIDNGYGQHSSNAFTYALTYILDPRYSLVYAGQVDFDYGAAVRNDIALVRKYHRLYWSLSYSRDESLDRQSIGFSLWPQGVPQLAFGSDRYMELGGSAGF